MKKVSTDECLLFAGSVTGKGYGIVSIHDGVKWVNRRVHRLMYEKHVKYIEDGLVIDHLCRVPTCINPDHLEEVTVKENTLRGEGLAANYAKRTVCKNGHLYQGNNLIIAKDNSRKCRTCAREYATKNYQTIGKYRRLIAKQTKKVAT